MTLTIGPASPWPYRIKRLDFFCRRARQIDYEGIHIYYYFDHALSDGRVCLDNLTIEETISAIYRHADNPDGTGYCRLPVDR